MRANLAEREGAEFDVPNNYWRDTLAALSPSRYDPHPAEWVWLGGLHITTKQGESHSVLLFWAPHPGAFKVGKTYYRGGDSDELRAVLEKACAESKINADHGTK